MSVTSIILQNRGEIYVVLSNTSLQSVQMILWITLTRIHSCSLPASFIHVAYYLEQFVCSLARIIQWESHLQSFKRQSGTNLRQGFAILFAQHLLGTLDFAQDPLNYEFLNVPMGLAPSSFMKMFFNGIPTENVLWFQALDSDGCVVQKLII